MSIRRSVTGLPVVRSPVSRFALALGLNKDFAKSPIMPLNELLEDMAAKHTVRRLAKCLRGAEAKGKEVSESIYNTYLVKAVKERFFKEAWEHLKEVKVIPSQETVTTVLHGLRTHWYPQKLAVEVVNDMRRLKVPLTPKALYEYGVWLSMPEHAKEVVDICGEILSRGADEVRDNIRVFTKAMVAVAKSGDQATLRKMIDEIEDVGVSMRSNPYAHLAIITARGRNRDLPGVIKAASDAMEHSDRHITVYHAIMDAYQRCGKVHETMKIFHQLRTELGKDDPALKPVASTYNLAIDALGRAGMMDEAEKLLQTMAEDGLKPRAREYNVLANGYAQLGMSAQAEALLKRAQRKKKTATDSFTYTTVLNAHLKNRDLAGAHETLLEMIAKFDDPQKLVAAFNALLNAYGKLRDMEKVAELVEKMESLGANWDRTTYNTLVDVHLKAGETERALEIYNSMKAQKLEPDPFIITSFIHAYGRSGRLRKAVDFYGQMREAGVPPDLPTYNSVIYAYVRNGQLDRAEATIESMHNAGIVGNAITYTTLIGAFAKDAKPGQVLKILGVMESLHVQPTMATYNGLLAAYVGAQDLLALQTTYDDLLKKPNFQPDLITFNLLLNAHATALDLRGIVMVFEDMQRRGFCDDEISRTALLRYSNHPELRVQLEATALGSHRRELAAAFERTVPIEPVQLHALAPSESSEMPDGESERPEDVQPDAAGAEGPPEDTTVVDDLEDRALAPDLGTLAVVRSLGSGVEKTESAFADIQRHGEIPDTLAYAALIRAYLLQNNFVAAAAALDEMESLGVRADVGIYNALIAHCALTKDLDRGIELMDRATELRISPNAFTLNCMLYMYALKGNWKSVKAIRKSYKRRILPDLGYII